MLLLGILSFFQITIIPGSIILKYKKVSGSILQWAVYAFALSVIANYCLVLTLTIVGLYNQTSMISILIVELTGLILLYKKDLPTPFFNIFEYHIGNLKNIINSLLSPNKDKILNNTNLNLFNLLLTVSLLAIVINGIIWTIRIFIGNIGSVFNTWDAVVSWNRWALSWTSGQIPLDTASYPQLIPVSWSTTYIFMGNTIIQIFAKGIMPLFAIFLLAALLDLGLSTRSIGFYIGGILTQSLIKKFLQHEITSGYVDVAVAFFCFMAIYSLIKAYNMDDPSQQKQHLFLGAVFAAGAGVTKQPGMYIFVLYPILAYISMANKNIFLFKKNTKKYVSFFILIALIPLSWYIFKQIHYTQNIDAYNFQEYLDVTENTYTNISLEVQIISAISRLENYLILFAFVIVGFPLLNSFYRALTILVIFPYPLIWAWLAGYDMRNLAIFMPIFALTAGIALQEIYLFITKKINKTIFIQIKTYHLILVFLILSLSFVGFASRSTNIVERQTQLQKQIFSPKKNEIIYEIIERDGAGTKILTNYPIRYLPGLEENQIQFGFQNFDTFITWVENPSTKYLLFSNRASDQIKDYIEKKIEDGDYELVFVDREWVKYTMVRIINR